MPVITFKIETGEEVRAEAVAGEKLLDVARKVNVAIDAPCSGNGSCGKCRVRLESGELDSEKTRHISDEDYAAGWRLACGSAVKSDAAVFVPDIASAYKSRMKVADLSDERETAIFEETIAEVKSAGIGFGTDLELITLQLDEPSQDDNRADLDRLCDALGIEPSNVYLGAVRKLPAVLRGSDFKINCLVRRRGGQTEAVDLWPAGEERTVCGVAIDIGTTTVSAVLMDLHSGRILAKASSGNGQIRYGADVINRIIEASREGGLEKLRRAVTEETVIPIIRSMCAAAGVDERQIYRITIAGNTTMNHMFFGTVPDAIRLDPYVPAFMSLKRAEAWELGLPAFPRAELICAPNIGSYVGGDITAGTLSSMLWNSDEYRLFIDLGTNGELVFGSSDFMLSCACSAGPAFEGGDISCGMRATDGAIESCVIDPEDMSFSFGVIGGGKPVGLCGSGLIDTIAELFRCRIIDSSGKIRAEDERLSVDAYGQKSYILVPAQHTGTGRDISISEVDLDNFIRAKAAIFSAVRLMLGYADSSVDDISQVLIAGGIGSGINMDNAVRIGMLPDIPREKYKYIGNSSLTGACCMLLSDMARDRVDEIASNMTYIELSQESSYMDEFVSACFLPHTDASLFPSSFGL